MLASRCLAFSSGLSELLSVNYYPNKQAKMFASAEGHVMRSALQGLMVLVQAASGCHANHLQQSAGRGWG